MLISNIKKAYLCENVDVQLAFFLPLDGNEMNKIRSFSCFILVIRLMFCVFLLVMNTLDYSISHNVRQANHLFHDSISFAREFPGQ